MAETSIDFSRGSKIVQFRKSRSEICRYRSASVWDWAV